jgi:single-stranded DNA-binding protein
MNEVKISGKICNVKHETLPSGKKFSTFGLSVWMGKKDGKNVYEFINCEMWDEHIVTSAGDKDVFGQLKIASWVGKDGKKQTKTSINVKSITDSEHVSNCKDDLVSKDSVFADSLEDDEVPF